jgi:hypothetical protein
VFQSEGFEFRHIKGRFTGALFDERDQPVQMIDAIFQFIEEATLERVFQEWMVRLAQYCVAVSGLFRSQSDSPRQSAQGEHLVKTRMFTWCSLGGEAAISPLDFSQ